MQCLSEIRKEKGISTLYVDHRPFFALSGEVHNSSASDMDFMKNEVWPKLTGMNMNSVIVPVYWEIIEPAEGEYNFAGLDELINQARENEMKLILLWFGLWKNSESMYVPAWMKKDQENYFRVRKVNGEAINTVSPLCEAAVEKDAEAFAAVMAHIRDVDADEATVIMMQVENEIGVLDTARDYSVQAEKAFSQQIPSEIEEIYGLTGTWKEAFGDDAEEYFMACYFAKAVEKITRAGRKEYPLPCYTNAWLRQYPWYAGSYPSGGPVETVHKIWKKMAPSLFTLAPDVYVSYAAEVMDTYGYEENPLMVPEVRKDAATAAYCLYAFAKHNAICYSPFGIEDLALDPALIEKPSREVMLALNIDPSALDTTGSRAYLARVYQLVREMEPLYLQYRGTDGLQCYMKRSDTDYGTYLKFREYNLQVAYSPKLEAKPYAAGVVYELAANKFLIVGMMSTLKFMPKSGEDVKIDYIKLEEGELKNGQWQPGRILNGDEKMTLKLGDLASCYMVELFKY